MVSMHSSVTNCAIFIMFIAQPTATTLSLVSVYEGESITITCTATGVPAPSVNWSRADNSSLTDSRYVISDTSFSVMVNDVYQVTRNLTIMSSVREDIGMEYSCIATNVLGTAQSNVSITVFCKLIIMYTTILYVICICTFSCKTSLSSYFYYRNFNLFIYTMYFCSFTYYHFTL